ncbi:hypothetical protein P22_0331 [Propionispora sp. 2/2-37]|uniref:hypothetical protein n=1 Tax=Propionispora sp. 2/2-37 TaxID=1677858 RepID=UPI0006BB7971|nr:hypothetical protein [Propionispora sp. 2/2-37]CUH94265.1 hypothetical protein P22_0331 [Propionispora sp. 2/2-37]
MEYVIIIFAAISVTTLIVYKVGSRLSGINLRIRSLALCAICALFISLVLPRIVVGFAGLPATMLFLLFFAVIFAYFIARYDNAEYHFLKKTPDNVLVEKTNSALPLKGSTGAVHNQNNILTENQLFDTIANPGKIAEGVSKKVTQELLAVKANKITNEQGDKTNYAQYKFDANNTSGQDITDFADIDSLDELIEKGFIQKEQHNFNQALQLFRRALNSSIKDEAAPFLIVEIGNILKDKGAYDEAIQTFLDGRNLHALHKNHSLEQEFVSAIAFLRIVKNTLLQHRLGFIPYNDIPQEVMEEINDEFREWHKLS